MFESFGKDLTYAANEKKIIEFWKTASIFEKSLALRSQSPRFVFYEGPPTANGLPGVHHVMARTVKDLVCRYKTMQGFLVERKAGWDTHGLPVEIEVEQELNITSKDQIEKYGVKAFNRRCKESVFKYEKEWRQVTERIGFWLDLDHPYITCTNEYIESVWWLLKKFWDRGAIYRAHKILPYCPRCGTPLSSHEVSQGYRDVEDPSVYVRFRHKTEPGTSFLVWTTTPWTLISNVALAVHPEEKYVRVKTGGESLILARARIGALSSQYEIVEEFPGGKLEGSQYEPVFPFFASTPDAFRVETAEFVTMEDGTGIVHVAPAFGEDDYNLGREKSLPVLQPVDGEGRFTEDVTTWANVFVKDADKDIIRDLLNRGLLYGEEKVVHSYPFCWRCDSPLIYYARKSWYIRTTSYRDLMVECNSKVEWYPRDIGVSRFANWIENNVDWALSRDRFWGTPLNVWICEACAKEVCVGSIEELKNLGAVLPQDLDLHKPMVDELVLNCPACGGSMRRTPEVIDCWFDSGSMPYAQWHYPFENRDKFEQNFPADFISEGMDQSRGWFYSLLAISSFVSGESSFKSVVPIEMILDKNGQRMSKSRGNAAEPAEILEKEGADALRWYLVTTSPPWIPTKFDRDGVTEVASKFLGTLRNTCQFFVLYANIDGFRPSGAGPFEPKPCGTDSSGRSGAGGRPKVGYELSLIDRWIISKLNSLTRQVGGDLESYEITRAARAIQEFVIEDLSNWYIRKCRRRFWKSELGPDKLGAYETLYGVLNNVARLIAPIAPFVSEEIHQKIARKGNTSVPESVHLCDFPQFDESAIDSALEEKMRAVMDIISLGRALRNAARREIRGRALRNDAKFKIRQPLRAVYVVGAKRVAEEALAQFGDLVKEELNVKEVRIDKNVPEKAPQDDRSVTEYVAKPKFEALGPRFGKRVNEVAKVIKSLDQEGLQRIHSGGTVEIETSEGKVVLSSAEVEVTEKKKEGLELALESAALRCPVESEEQPVFGWGDREGTWGVWLTTKITDELRREGTVREFVHRLQSLRKTAGLEVSDRIVLYYEAGANLRSILEASRDYIASEALAESIEPALPGDVAGIADKQAKAIEGESLAERVEPALPKTEASGGFALEEWTLDGEKVKVALKKAE
ncbi:MAG: isoleucine--tRNA ligase [Candidatus Eisenbacteria bacterium]|nr:isoleucine--tRNA ligase [Candidatus Eisenbacteria bacterium]